MDENIQKIFIIATFSFIILLIKNVNAYQYFLANLEIITSDSEPDAENVEYKFRFKTNYPLNAGQRIKIIFPDTYQSPIASSTDLFCPTTMLGSVEGRVVFCTVKAGEVHPATTTEIVVKRIKNPPKEKPEGIADFHFFQIETDANEGAFFPVSIVEPLSARGVVNPILNLEIQGLTPGERVHQILVTSTTTANSINFQDIPVNTSLIGAQDIFVRTNAAYGFILNIVQTSDLQAIDYDRGRIYKIYCFENGRCKNYTQAIPWLRPEGILGAPQTYGHFAITSEDNSLGENCSQNYYGFGQGGKWAGLEVGVGTEVMRNCQPSDGITQHQGWTRIGFRVEVTPLQPGGNYETTFTYVLIPIF